MLAFLLAAAGASTAPPWDVWSDLARLAVATPGHQVLSRTSHCPSGCRYDRTDVGDPRFLRVEGDEQVVFEETGAGAIVRIWMTQTDALDPDVRLRVRVDGEARPRIDLKVSELFGGRRPPFVPPLVADRERSSGGYVSYVPIPYRRGCKVSLVGALDRRLWFQFTFHRLRDASGVATFRGDEDLTALARLLGAQGEDPWSPDAGTLEHRQVELAPGRTEVLRSYDTPGTLTGLRLRLPPAAWSHVRLRLELDGQPRVNLSLEDLFGTSPAPGMRSALVGRDASGALYLWLPIPFQRSAVVRLVNPSGASVPVWYEVRRRTGPPLPGSLPFAARALQVGRTLLDADFPLLDGLGSGRWVGLHAELQSVGIDGREYLEGDDRIFVDGSAHPALYGTGVEDFIGGGFYFERGPFRLGTHGSPAHDVQPNGEDRTSMYRFFLTDAIPFATAVKAGLESGPTGDLPMRARRVAWFYADRAAALESRAVLDLGDGESRRLAAYTVEGDEVCRDRTGSFEGEPEVAIDYVSCRRTAGASRFTFRVEPSSALRLRRRFEATAGEQRAHVFVNGVHVGTYPPVEPNPFRSLREDDLDLPPTPGGTLRFTIEPADGLPFTEVRWELWASPAQEKKTP